MKKTIWIAAILIAMSFSAKSFAQTATPGVTKKQIQQQARIQEGVNSGDLTPREKRHLQAQQAKIQHSKRVAKADGVVTPQERRKIKREQRRANANIYVQKHDAQTR
jgi:tellurite resistance protein